MKDAKWAILLLRAVHDILIACGILFVLMVAGVV